MVHKTICIKKSNFTKIQTSYFVFLNFINSFARAELLQLYIKKYNFFYHFKDALSTNQIRLRPIHKTI